MLNSFIQTIAKIVVTPLLFVLSLSGHPIVQSVPSIPSAPIVIHDVQPAPQNQIFGAYNPTGASTYYLQGGISTSATTIYLSSFKEPVSNIPYTMTYLNSNIEYAVLDPGTLNRSEFISFSGITQNSDGSAVITGVIRGLSRSYPFTASTTLAQTHAAQAQFVLSDSPQVFAQYAAKQNDETITGSWSFPTPLASNNPATKTYVDNLVNGGPVSINQVVVAGTAGETVAAGQVLYFKQADARWYKAAITIAEASSTVLGISQGSGTSGNPITGGILTSGIDSNQSGLTAGRNYFLSSTAGVIGLSTTTRIVGRAAGVTQLYFNTSIISDANLYISNSTFTGNNTFTGSTTLASSTQIGSLPAFRIGKNKQIYSAAGSFSFNLPAGVNDFYVCVQAAGGGGGGGTGAGVSSGGAGGGYACGYISTTTNPVTITVGAKGAGGNNSTPTAGATGGLSSFGTGIICTGGGGASAQSSSVNQTFGVGGTCTGGDFNMNGQNGLPAHTATGLGNIPGAGGNSAMGFGGNPGELATTHVSGTGYGSGGGGIVNNTTGGGDGTDGWIGISW